MTHPWDDLTDGELKKMVDFCRKHFRKSAVKKIPDGFSLDLTGAKKKWKWKKGDWYWYCDTNDKTGGHVSLEIYNVPIESPFHTPLPLAHQWMEMIANIDDDIGFFPDECKNERWWAVMPQIESDGFIESHKNPHYACYLAFRAVVERD